MEKIKLDNNFNESPSKRNNKGIWIGIAGFLALFIIVVAIVVGVSGGDGTTNSNYLTSSNYSRIHNGMSAYLPYII